MRRALPFLAAALVLTACAESTPGTPSAGSAPTTTASGSSQPSGSAKPSTSATPKKRPKTINIKDVDPCTLLTDAQRAKLGLGGTPTKQTDDEGYQECTVSREDHKYLTGMTVYPDRGVEYYSGGAKTPEPIEIAGFPALKMASSMPLGDSCAVVVDVSDGQVVSSDVMAFGALKGDAVCEPTLKTVTEVVATLVAK
ncbi:DUF3558 domain-containing protein [Saccharothrix violaceirubra]|uniref:DUF3558 domain-containing protein n=1 Tax=Saccharothrix violaceirubra TaxID=413306 RepID=A0A7W7TAH5_9PSEU|nr:DUF3558 domain-containing protein [Saccharothrix violaceirubra]MBB4969539.1 hypothetical protein [Saccharothrix violaceirubra]